MHVFLCPWVSVRLFFFFFFFLVCFYVYVCVCESTLWFPCLYRLVGLVVTASASRAEDPGFKFSLLRDFFGVESCQWLKNWHSSGYPTRRLEVLGQRWDWLARCQYTVTGWDGSATSISVWQHVKLSEQIRPWETLACCWNVKQPTSKFRACSRKSEISRKFACENCTINQPVNHLSAQSRK